MDRLWAPWRSAYITKCVSSKKGVKCIFCVGRSAKNDKRRYILTRSRHAFSILNPFPYNNGHVMVAPYRHIRDFERLSQDEILDMMRLLEEAKTDLDRHLKPHGYNIGMNLGRASGAGFDGHIHMHIVPRWVGDTNFMSIVADARIISRSLAEMHRLLKQA